VPSAWALVPIKRFPAAKSRLSTVFSREECNRLAESMARDVLRALIAAPEIAGIAILTAEPSLAQFPEAAGARLFAETPGGDYCADLAATAASLAASGARTLVVLPSDLPTLSAASVRALLTAHTTTPEGVTVAAARDGGTNALVLTPPTIMPFLFGPDSATRHMAAASARGVACQRLDIPAFARDIDTPEDVQWLIGQRVACATIAWLRASGIVDRLKQQAAGGE
jgi:2-phospho-L-lactate guanylyltransferase